MLGLRKKREGAGAPALKARMLKRNCPRPKVRLQFNNRKNVALLVCCREQVEDCEEKNYFKDPSKLNASGRSFMNTQRLQTHGMTAWPQVTPIRGMQSMRPPPNCKRATKEAPKEPTGGTMRRSKVRLRLHSHRSGGKGSETAHPQAYRLVAALTSTEARQSWEGRKSPKFGLKCLMINEWQKQGLPGLQLVAWAGQP